MTRQARIDKAGLDLILGLIAVEDFAARAQAQGWTTDKHGLDIAGIRRRLVAVVATLDLIDVSAEFDLPGADEPNG